MDKQVMEQQVVDQQVVIAGIAIIILRVWHALDGMVCYTDSTKRELESMLSESNLSTRVFVRPRWYF